MRRSTAWLLVPLLAVVSCAQDEEPLRPAGVTIEALEGWERVDPEPADDVLETLRWESPDEEVSSLQVIAACGPDTTAEQLLAGAATGERPMPVVDADGRSEHVDVEGLEEALEATLLLGASPEDVRARMAGLYGVGDGVLVLVELLRPTGRFDEEEAAEVLGSVSVDTGELAPRCDDEDPAGPGAGEPDGADEPDEVEEPDTDGPDSG